MDSQQNPNNGTGSGQGWQYNPNSGGSQKSGGSPTPPKKGFDIGEWIPIIVLFCIPSGVTQIIAVVWALKKVADMMSRAQKEKLGRDVRRAAGQVKQGVEDVFREFSGDSRKAAGQTAGQKQGAPKGQAAGQSQDGRKQTASDSGNANPYSSHVRYSARPEPQPAQKKAAKIPGGLGMVIPGSVIAGLFGLLTVVGGVEYFHYRAPDELSAVAVCAAFCLAGLVTLGLGIGKNRRRERFRNYLGYIGANQEVALAPMAAAFGVPVRKLCKDLRRMLADGILPTGYLDLAAGKLFLSETGYRAPEPEQAADAAPEPDDDAILREIRQINDDIPDPEMSAKIDRIEEITARILIYQKAHPERSSVYVD